jgi:hypothetical protein
MAVKGVHEKISAVAAKLRATFIGSSGNGVMEHGGGETCTFQRFPTGNAESVLSFCHSTRFLHALRS